MGASAGESPSSEGLCKAGPQLLLSNGPHGELWGRSSHREAVAGVQRVMRVAGTRLLAVGIEGSGSFRRELGGSFVRIEELHVVGGKGSCRVCARSSGLNNQADVGTT